MTPKTALNPKIWYPNQLKSNVYLNYRLLFIQGLPYEIFMSSGKQGLPQLKVIFKQNKLYISKYNQI